MEELENLPGSDQDGQAAEIMESVGMPGSEGESSDIEEPEKDELGVFKERLGRQEKRHKKELRALQQQIAALSERSGNNMQPQPESPPQNPYMAPQEAQPAGDDERIHRAVAMALHHRDLGERKAKEAENQAYVSKQYQALHEMLDKGSDKYEDFDDVVRAHDAPYTDAMKDTAVLLPNADEVLYKLGKDREQLKKISALHPIEQAKEMMKLSHALMGGQGQKSQSAPRPLGYVKSNPVTSSGAITDKTSVSELRKRMKAGWK